MSIFLSMPLVMSKKTGEMRTKVFNAVAIGILIFLVADVFSDVTGILYDGSLMGYGSSPYYDAIFVSSFAAGFLALFAAENRSRDGLSPSGLALIIAVGIGFQNLTEGLLFGSLGVRIGLGGATLVVLVGFVFQNVTEGFPITSPFFGHLERKTGVIASLLMVGGVPAIIGGGIGHYYSSQTFVLVFDGLAIGAMSYVILPMLKGAFRDMDYSRQRMVYLGVFLGFVAGFLVNLI
jgi:zinc transporter, ZIP family